MKTGEELRDEGIKRATQSLEVRAWIDRGMQAIKDLGEGGYLFNADTVRERIGDPPTPAAMGALFNKATRRLMVKKVGEVAMLRATAHARRTAVYSSFWSVHSNPDSSTAPKSVQRLYEVLLAIREARAGTGVTAASDLAEEVRILARERDDLRVRCCWLVDDNRRLRARVGEELRSDPGRDRGVQPVGERESGREMSVRIVIECAPLSDLWATTEELSAMTDEEIVNLAREDVISMLDGATFRVVREGAGDE